MKRGRRNREHGQDSNEGFLLDMKACYNMEVVAKSY